MSSGGPESTEVGEWEWSNEHGCYMRWYREQGGEWELECEKLPSDDAEAGAQSLGTIHESDAYDVAGMTRGLESTTFDTPDESRHGKGKAIARTTDDVTGMSESVLRANDFGAHSNADASQWLHTAILATKQRLPRAPGLEGAKLRTPDPIVIWTKVDFFTPSYRIKPLTSIEYTLHKSKDFKFGRVFKCVWSEPKGGSGGTEITETAFAAKGPAHSKVRPFLIVETFKGHSLCLPILTYLGQGTLKWGVHPEDHALIYSSHEKPELLDGEQLSKKAIRVEITDPSHKLDPASRLNYAKIYTVEHNVKVHFIGKVIEKHENRVVADYNLAHTPLPDRPYVESDENAARYTEGPDPNYPGNENYAMGGQASHPSPYMPLKPRASEFTDPDYPDADYPGAESSMQPPSSHLYEDESQSFEAGEGGSEHLYDNYD